MPAEILTNLPPEMLKLTSPYVKNNIYAGAQNGTRANTGNVELLPLPSSSEIATQPLDSKEVYLSPNRVANPGTDIGTLSMIPAPGSLLDRYDSVVSFDSEYEAMDGRNVILSYQATAVVQVEGIWRVAEYIYYPDAGERLTSSRVIGMALERAGVGYKRAEGMKVLLVCHWAIADFCSLSDRSDFMKNLKPIRRTLVATREFKWHADFGNKNYANITLGTRDTWLLAPQGAQSLDALSTYTTRKKIAIDPQVKSHMSTLLQDDPALFEQYAMEDTKVTLEYLVRVAETAQRVVHASQLPLTLGGAAVSAFTEHLGGREAKQFKRTFGKVTERQTTKKGVRVQTVKGESRRLTETLAADSYHGGLNMAYWVGHYECEPDEMVLDIDLNGAYVSAFGAIPEVDWFDNARYITSPARLQEYFSDRSLSERGHIPNILGLVEFEFPEGELYPCLPGRFESGLAYLSKGITFCTGIEIDLALRMGATVKLKEVKYFPFYRHEDHRPVLPFADFLGVLAKERETYPKGTLPNMLLKEIGNSLYGKTAQGIRLQVKRNFYAGSDGEYTRNFLPESAVTTPHYAAACTGIIRAALATLVSGLSKCPGFRVLSATTDGCMIVAPKRIALEAVPANDKGKLDVSGVDLLGMYPELQALESYPAIKALILGRRNMKLSETWIELKHVGDAADSMKTRVNCITYKGIVQHRATTGINRENAYMLDAYHADTGIPIQQGKHLPSAHEIMTGEVKDYIDVPIQKRVNTDYDFKRMLLDDGTTVPFADKTKFAKIRDAASGIRKCRTVKGEKVVGQRATPDRVLAVSAGMRLRKGETMEDVYRRYVCWAVARREHGWNVLVKDKELAAKLGLDYQKQFRVLKRRQFEPQKFPFSERFEAVMRDVARKVGLHLTKLMIDVLASTQGQVKVFHPQSHD
jgi:hypothetical protein